MSLKKKKIDWLDLLMLRDYSGKVDWVSASLLGCLVGMLILLTVACIVGVKYCYEHPNESSCQDNGQHGVYYIAQPNGQITPVFY